VHGADDQARGHIGPRDTRIHGLVNKDVNAGQSLDKVRISVRKVGKDNYAELATGVGDVRAIGKGREDIRDVQEITTRGGDVIHAVLGEVELDLLGPRIAAVATTGLVIDPRHGGLGSVGVVKGGGNICADVVEGVTNGGKNRVRGGFKVEKHRKILDIFSTVESTRISSSGKGNGRAVGSSLREGELGINIGRIHAVAGARATASSQKVKASGDRVRGSIIDAILDAKKIQETVKGSIRRRNAPERNLKYFGVVGKAKSSHIRHRATALIKNIRIVATIKILNNLIRRVVSNHKVSGNFDHSVVLIRKDIRRANIFGIGRTSIKI